MKIVVSGGGPVGLTFALALAELELGSKVNVVVHDSRWCIADNAVHWKDEQRGNAQRQQVVTIQSNQYLKWALPTRRAVFEAGHCSQMWPTGADSQHGYPPANVRIAHVEDRLLQLAAAERFITLVPEDFNPAVNHAHMRLLADADLLVISEGSGSRTRGLFAPAFGTPDVHMYSLSGTEPLRDIVLGLRVKSHLDEPTSVALTISQGRFLLNSLNGEGFLNVRLTDEEAHEVAGVVVREGHPLKLVECVQRHPCLLERDDGDFVCRTHGAFFFPAMQKKSPLWRRVVEGLQLYGVEANDLSAITAFGLEMIHRPRFTAPILSPKSGYPRGYACLIGDAANAIHFWPGRGLNAGIASAISLARTLKTHGCDVPLRDADFALHEAVMAMIQYRNKTRAWRTMVTQVPTGGLAAVKARIRESQLAPISASEDERERAAFLETYNSVRSRLIARLPGIRNVDWMRAHIGDLSAETIRTLNWSGSWDTAAMGGQEVDLDLFYPDLAKHHPRYSRPIREEATWVPFVAPQADGGR